ncbi:MAG: hypothetical protein KDC75_15575, partial [Phaeodactylibacter sp.]|nr:hypothetical protein [Phaeodactylibacter sp.]
FSKDEQQLLTYSLDGTAQIWILDIERVIKQLYHTYPVMMSQPLDEKIKQRYGLEGLYMDRMR